jgi:hypothetical protein
MIMSCFKLTTLFRSGGALKPPLPPPLPLPPLKSDRPAEAPLPCAEGPLLWKGEAPLPGGPPLSANAPLPVAPLPLPPLPLLRPAKSAMILSAMSAGLREKIVTPHSFPTAFL